MTSEASPRAIAARLVGILGGQDRGMIEATARRLGVSEVALRISIDSIEPHPAVEVIAAIVKHHGVDPTWLLTGEYDSATHRAALDEDTVNVYTQIGELFAKRMTPTAADSLCEAHPNLRLEA